MSWAGMLVVLACGLLIGLAVFLLVRSLRAMAKGRCCEGCDSCPQADACSSREAHTRKKGG